MPFDDDANETMLIPMGMGSVIMPMHFPSDDANESPLISMGTALAIMPMEIMMETTFLDNDDALSALDPNEWNDTDG